MATRKPAKRKPAALVKAITKAAIPGNELGTTGLRRTGNRGLITEEFLTQLTGERGRRLLREMRDNDPVVGAILWAVESLIRNVTWTVEGVGGEDKDKKAVEFVESCMSDMSHTWEDFIAEVLSMLPFGFSWHEVVYKRRSGQKNDPSQNSRYNDGLIGWRKLPIRAQESLYEWVFDEEGGVQAFVQQTQPDYRLVEIPINRSLLFRTGVHKGNPEGRSILRNAFRPWILKKRIEEIEGIGIERDLAGLPVIYRTGEIAQQYDAELEKIVKNIRRDEQEGVLLPLAFDENGNQLIRLELLSSAGSRQFDLTKTIDRYDRRIAVTVLADFILMGQSAVGSFALASSKTELFATSLGAILKSIAGVLNRHALPRLFILNNMPLDTLPTIVPGDLETPDLEELGRYITALAGSGAMLFPDEELENHLRTVAHLPPKPVEEE
jgi:hypothetical protein